MRRTVITLAATSLFAGGAFAADLSIYAPPIVPVLPQQQQLYDWTGFYLGVHGGLAGGRFDYPFYTTDGGGDPDITGQADITAFGGFAGGQVGYNWQPAPNWLFGVEADIAWSGYKGELGFEVDGFDVTLGSKVNWFGTVRGRLGFVQDRWVVYGTGGFAYGEVEHGYSITGLGSDSISESQHGWTAGAGIEYALTDNLTFKTEYLYVDLGKTNLLSISPEDDGFVLDATTKFHTIKAGLNLRFGGGHHQSQSPISVGY